MTTRGQALVELALCLPIYLALVAGGFGLYQLGVGRTELAIAARVGVASPDPPTAVRAYLSGNSLVRSDEVKVTNRRAGNVRSVTVRWEARPLKWLGARGCVLVATAALGEAVLCVR